MFSGIRLTVLSVLALCVASPAWAVEATVFDCKLFEKYEGKEIEVHAKFAVSGLEKGARHAEYEYLDKDSAEIYSPVIWTPRSLDKEAENEVWPSVNTLNDNAIIRSKPVMKQVVDKKTKKKKWVVDNKKKPSLELVGDGDGVIMVYLVLYEASDYRKGYFKITGETNEYQEITCTHREKTLPDFEEEE